MTPRNLPGGQTWYETNMVYDPHILEGNIFWYTPTRYETNINNYKKGPGAVGCDMGGGSGLNRGSLGMEKLYCPMCYYSTWKD